MTCICIWEFINFVPNPAMPTSRTLFSLRCMVIAVVGAVGHEPGSLHDRHAAQQGRHDDPDPAAVCTGVL